MTTSALDGSHARLVREHYLPARIYVQAVRRCNLTCAMCGWEIWQRNAGVMSEPVFTRVFDDMVKYGVKEIGFTSAQGEPLLARATLDYVDRCVGAGFTLVMINTNVTPLGERVIERLAKAAYANTLHVQLSFSGYDKASYEFIYKGARFEDSSRKLKAVYDAFDQLGKLKSLAIRGVILDNTPKEWHSAYVASLGIDVTKLDYAEFLPADNFAGLVPYGGHNNPRVSLCPYMAHRIVVYDDGKVSACASRDSEGQLEIGDITQDDLMTICNGDRRMGYIDSFLKGDVSHMMCHKCDFAYT